jgi:nucleotide-binding universal stress UspA family protein
MKKIVICVDLNQDCINTLKSLSGKFDLKYAKVYFLHIFENQIYNNDLVPFVYPLPEQYKDFEKSTQEILDQLGHDLDLLPDKFKSKCFFAFSREQKIKEFLIETEASLVVLATRGRHGIKGFFTSSLADFLCKYSPCDVFVLRPEK